MKTFIYTLLAALFIVFLSFTHRVNGATEDHSGGGATQAHSGGGTVAFYLLPVEDGLTDHQGGGATLEHSGNGSESVLPHQGGSGT